MVLLSDVLEHLPDPPRLLEEVRSLLKPGGQLIASLPNVVHWSVRAQVALGKFEYTNRGILDRGHLRFFTRSTAQRMFEAAGFRVKEVRTTPAPWENVLPAKLEAVADVAEKVDTLCGHAHPGAFAYQYIFDLQAPGATLPPPAESGRGCRSQRSG